VREGRSGFLADVIAHSTTPNTHSPNLRPFSQPSAFRERFPRLCHDREHRFQLDLEPKDYTVRQLGVAWSLAFGNSTPPKFNFDRLLSSPRILLVLMRKSAPPTAPTPLSWSQTRVLLTAGRPPNLYFTLLEISRLNFFSFSPLRAQGPWLSR